RRHTRSKRDWSSDVCSSDLKRMVQIPAGGRGGDPQRVDEFLHGHFLFLREEVEDLAHAFLLTHARSFSANRRNSSAAPSRSASRPAPRYLRESTTRGFASKNSWIAAVNCVFR